MAKNKVDASLNLDDNGDLKKIEKDAKAAGKGLGKTAKGAHSADRRLKGAAQASSNSTKNFSKMSQGISGGLVPAYATLAASLFAVDAAFMALKRASDLRVQQAGMLAYATNSGIALKSIARDLQAATGHQLDFKEAAESTSIAISAGFSADQITQIGKAARIASIALGRDFADSYQRLLKGITKAEPELLDELGIILRLEKATKVYAASIGKTAKDLTAYERQQAVFNEVITQTAEKYAMVGDSVPVSVMGQLGATFTDLTDSFLTGIAPIAEFFGSILVNSTTSAIAAMGVFAASILKNVIPPLDVMITKATTAWGAMTGSGKAAWGSFKGIGSEFSNAKKIMTGTPARGLSGAQAMAKGGLKGAKGKGLESLRKGGGMTKAQIAGLKRSLKSAEAQWKKHGAIVSGNLAGMNIKNVRSMQASLTMMQASHIKFFAAVKVGWKSLWTTAKLSFTMIGAAWKATAAGMKIVAAGLGAAMNKALGIIGWIGMLFMMKDIFIEIGNSWDKILKSIGGMIEKIGRWIEDLGNKLGPNSVVGKFMQWAGKSISARGTIVIERGAAMAPEMESRRNIKAFSGKIEEIKDTYAERGTEIDEMRAGWDAKRGIKGFNRRAAEMQMLASTGGLQDFSTLKAMRDNLMGGGLTREEIEAWRADPDKDKPKFEKLPWDPSTLPLEDYRTEAEKSWDVENQRKLGIAVDEYNAKLVESRTALKPIADYYRKLGETDPEYLQVAKLIDKGELEKARIEIVRLTNEYGSHIQALKDMKSAEEGRNKRLAEYMIKAQELSETGQEVARLSQSMSELSDKNFDATTSLATFYRFFGKDKVGHITDLADAQKYVNDELKEQLKVVKDIRDAKYASAQAQVGVSEAAGGAGLFQRAAAETLAVRQSNEEFLKFQRDSNDEIAGIRANMAAEDANYTTEQIIGFNKQIATIELLIEARKKLNDTAADMATDMGKLQASFKESFTDGMQKGIEGLIMGTKSLKEAFADMAKGILASMAKVLAEMMTKKLLQNTFGGFFATGRSGGVFSPPGYRSFATGGIASGPSGRGYGATLHGTEAVVPLPNDRHIPVKLSGGAGNTNNTNVTVNVAEGGQVSSEQTGETRGQQLGSVIAQAIEERLQDEQRPGGILFRPGGG